MVKYYTVSDPQGICGFVGVYTSTSMIRLNTARLADDLAYLDIRLDRSRQLKDLYCCLITGTQANA